MSSDRRCHVFILLCLIITVSAPYLAVVQAKTSPHVDSTSLEDRVVSLERITNATGQLLYQIQQQISLNQHDIEELRGQIESNQHRLNQAGVSR